MSTPTAPSVAIGNTTAAVTWAPVTGANSYTLQRSPDTVGWTTISSGIPNGTSSYPDSGLTNGQIYFYRIIAVAGSYSAISAASAAATPGITPLVPQGLTISTNNDGADLSLSWALVTGVTGYNVYQSTTSGGPYTLLGTTTSNTGYLVYSLTAGTAYYFVVSALNGSMESGKSGQASGVPQTTPAAPTATVNAINNIVLTWTAIAGVSTYTIQRSSDLTNFTTLATEVAAVTYTDSAAVSQTQYAYRYLTIYPNSVSGAFSATSSPVTSGTQPLGPTSLVAQASGTASVSLTWVQAPNTVKYAVYRGTASAGPFSKIATIASTITSYSDAAVSAGNYYYYVATSINNSGVESGYSNSAGVNLTAAPTGLAATPAANVINVSWNAVGGASSYILKRGVQSGGPYSRIQSGSSSTSFADSTLASATTYYYVVDTVYASGAVSPDSSEVSAVSQEAINLQVPIELTDQSFSSDTASVTFERTRTSLDTSAYDGTVTYYLEVVGLNSDSSAHTVSLLNSSNTVVGTLSIPTSAAVATRLRSTVTPTAGLENYRLMLDGTPTPGQVQVYSARLLVKQVGATKSKIYIPLLASKSTPSAADLSAFVETTYNQTYQQLASSSVYVRDTSVFADLANFNAWEMETLVAASGTATGAVTLYNTTQGAVVDDTETLFTGSGFTLTNTPFDDGVKNFGVTNQGDKYQVSLLCWENCTSNVSLYKANLWVSVTNLSKAEIIFRNAFGQASVSSTSDFDSERTLIDLSTFSHPSILFQAVGNLLSVGSGSLQLMSAGNSDSGAGFTAVAGSSVSFSSTVKNIQRTASPFTLTTGNRFVLDVAPSGANISVVDSAIVVDVTR